MAIPAQLLANGIIAGAIYILVALGFSLVFSTVRFFHFAHGIVFTAGAYFAFLFSFSSTVAGPFLPKNRYK
jgi:branched-subunit amino acid ABC-type transport system permease component